MYYLSINTFKEGVGSEEIGKVIPLHKEWIREMIASGAVVQAGKWGAAGGVVILKAESHAEAEGLLRNDPLIGSGLVNYELGAFHPDVKI